MTDPNLSLSDILITSELSARPAVYDAAAERTSLESLATVVGDGRESILKAVCALALVCSEAGSAGVSVLLDPEDEGFSWDALAGRFSPYLFGRAPRHDSPCGISLDTGMTQLFSHPERYFGWMRGPGIPIVEGLVVPLFQGKRRPFGSLWVMTHSEEARMFTSADAELLTRLGNHAAAAIQLSDQRR
jgi:GAF domain-containing protein